MRGQFEFRFHTIAPGDAAAGEVDPTLALMGTQGWEIRGTATLPDGTLSVALQRRLDADAMLPDAPELSAALSQPLPPPLELLERELTQPDENVAAG